MSKQVGNTPNNEKDGDKSKKDKQSTSSSNNDDKNFVEKTSGRLFVSSDRVLRSIKEACEAVMLARLNRPNKKSPPVDSSTEAGMDDPNASVETEAKSIKSPVWHKTDFGKSLKVTSHIYHKVGQHSADPLKVIQWKNVLGSVGAALGRGRRDSQTDEAVRSTIDEINLENLEPAGLIEQMGVLFQDPGHIAKSTAEKLRLKEEEKARKAEEKKRKAEAKKKK